MENPEHLFGEILSLDILSDQFFQGHWPSVWCDYGDGEDVTLDDFSDVTIDLM